MKTQKIIATAARAGLLVTALVISSQLAGCATESSQAIKSPQVAVAATPYQGARVSVVVGKFDNRSSYMRGLFSDGSDQLGSQAKTILIGHIEESGRFYIMDRSNMQELKQEAGLTGQAQALKGAQFVITGDVTAFGRKEVGDQQLFGILGRGKQQVAYAKVTLNVVDVHTSQVVYSVMGAGEYSLSNREIIGFGGTASYDSTLNGKVLDLAIRQAVDRLSQSYDTGAWGKSD